MPYDWITATFSLMALAALVFSGVVLSKSNWFKGWLRGTAGLLLAGLAVSLGLVALNFYSYERLLEEEPIATLSFQRLGAQNYKVLLSPARGSEQAFELRGDLWQLDARIIKWRPSLARIGLKSGYQLDRLSGRYLTLEQERSEERTVHGVSEEALGFDLWEFLQRNKNLVPGVDAKFGSATFVPMVDGGIFSVTLASGGLVARPLNDSANAALDAWN